MSAERSLDAVPVRRPQLHRKGDELYFLVSQRPLARLTRSQADTWDRIDGAKSIADLQRESSTARDAIDALHDSRLIEIIEPEVVSETGHLVIVEPHMDDALLSVGAELIRRKGRQKTTILTVFGRSNFTSYRKVKKDFRDPREITKLRREESALASRMVGAEHRSLDFEERSLAYASPEEWSLENLVRFAPCLAMSTTHPVLDDDVSRIENGLATELRRLSPTEIWFPMGLGRHGDHAATREACLRIAHAPSEVDSSTVWAIYEDVPYRNRFPEQAATVLRVLRDAGASLETQELHPESLTEKKMRLLEVYGSQFKVSAMEDQILGPAFREGDATRAVEVVHHIRRLPGSVPAICLHHRATALLELRGHLERFLQGHAGAPQLLVVSKLPFGRLDAGVQRLTAAFPSARIRLILPKRAEWEADRVSSALDRLDVRIVESEAGALQFIARAMLRRTPMIVCLPDGASFAGRVLRKTLARFPSLFCESPGELTAVLEALDLDHGAHRRPVEQEPT